MSGPAFVELTDRHTGYRFIVSLAAIDVIIDAPHGCCVGVRHIQEVFVVREPYAEVREAIEARVGAGAGRSVRAD